MAKYFKKWAKSAWPGFGIEAAKPETMFKSIVITSLRNFVRNKAFSSINLIGLSISMSLGMLIIIIVKEQYSFDNFHRDGERIYRVNTRVDDAEWGGIDFACAPLPVGAVLENEYEIVENMVRINRQLGGDVTVGNTTLPIRGLFTETSFFNVFHFPFESGDPATALAEPNGLILTSTAAEKIFGTRDVVGRALSLGRFGEFHVTGVLQEFAGKTHLDFEVLCPLSVLPKSSLDDWSAYYDNYVYVKTKAGTTADNLHVALANLVERHHAVMKLDERTKGYAFSVQGINHITPGPELSGQMGRGMPVFLVTALGVLAGIVLLMSILNFTNLTIAKSLSRAREIGVRKIVGAKRYQVFLQFIGEATVFSLIALIFSYVLLQFLKTGYLQLPLNSTFALNLQEGFSLYILFLLFAVVVGVLAGLLPAAYMSALRTSRVLKDAQHVKVYSRLTLRKMLMGTQFTLSVVFVIVVSIIYRQVDFLLNTEYGFEQKNTLSLRLQGVDFQSIATDVKALAGVERVGGVSHRMGTYESGSSKYKRTYTDPEFSMHEFYVDEAYVQNIAPTFLARSIVVDGGQHATSTQVILNEAALSKFGFSSPSEAIGSGIYVNDSVLLQVTGVVKDFHFRPMNNEIGPLALRYSPHSSFDYLNIRVHPAQAESVKAALATIWEKKDAVHLISLATMEDEVDSAYREAGMQDLLVIIGYVSFLTMSIACLGMLGMAMYSSQVRTKEIGVRKVMGASTREVVLLLSNSFLIMIGVSVVLGASAGILLGDLFLDDYVYKVQITPWLIAPGVAFIAGMGLLVVWSQTYKVASSDPVKSLRYE